MGEDSVRFSGTFQGHLQEEGLVQGTIPGDGNCLFRAIAQLVFLDDEVHNHVRSACCQFMESHPELLENILTGGQTVESYVTAMQRDGTWGGDLEITAFATLYNVQFRVHDERGKRSFTIRGHRGQPRDVPMYHLAYLRGSHYNLLLQVEDGTEIEAGDVNRLVVGRLRSEEETAVLRGYIRRFLQLIWNRTIDKERVLVICIPKVLKGDTAIEKLQNASNVETMVLYTVNYAGSTFLEQLSEDEQLNNECDVFYKSLLPEIGRYHQREWISALGLYYILHTHMYRPIRNIKFQFFFDHSDRALITHSIMHLWSYAKGTILEILPQLQANRLFCYKECTEECVDNHFSGHFSLSGIAPFPMKRDEVDQGTSDGALCKDHLSRWLFKRVFYGFLEHPLKPLLIPLPREWSNEDLPNSIDDIVQKTTPELSKKDKKFTVYVLLLVNPKYARARPPTMEDIWVHWSEQTAEFMVYIGCTTERSFRTAHAEYGCTDSPVAVRLTTSSSLFVVYSELYEDFATARQKESILIALCKLHKNLKKKTNQSNDYELLNNNNENMAFCTVDERTIDVCVENLDIDWRIFRFPEEDFASNDEMGNGNFVIIERLPIDFLDYLG